MQKLLLKSSIILALAFTCINSNAQDEVDRNTVIPTAAPFLNITPESRGGAMGDAGVATSPDINSQHWNSSKYAFLDQDMGISLSYTPWLRNLVSDINLYYLTFFKRIDKMQTFSASLRYFSLGTITFRESADDVGYTGQPNEFAIDAAYSRKLSDNFSGSVAFRYIRSDITNGSGDDATPGNAYAADLNFFYLNKVKWGGRKGDISGGMNISNLGSKISYDDGASNDFLPAYLRLGGAYSTEIDRYNKVGITIDITREMVANGDDNADISSPSSFFKSFGDASVDDLMISIGGEYWYTEQFALRAGYFYEDEDLGNGNFATAGTGIKFNMLTIDASYIITMDSDNALANTIRFSLGLNFDEMSGKRKKR